MTAAPRHAPIRVTRLGREPPRAGRAARRARSTPTACTAPSRPASRRTSATRAVVATTTLDEPEHGLTEEVLADTDVLVWWGHAAHGEVADEVVERVHRHVLVRDGPGRAALRPLVEDLRQADGHHLHPALAQRAGPRAGLDGQPDPPDRPGRAEPDHHRRSRRCTASSSTSRRRRAGLHLSSFTGGEVFRSGCTFRRGHGKIFFFSPGDQDYPVYHHKDVRRVIANGVEWAGTVGPSGTVPVLLRYETERLLQRARLRGARSSEPHARRAPDRRQRPLRLVQVGAGGDGPRLAATHRRESPDVELVGLVDLDPRGRTARRWPSTGLPVVPVGDDARRARGRRRRRRGGQRDGPGRAPSR